MKCIAMGKYSPTVIKGVLADPAGRVATMKAVIESLGGTWIEGFFMRGQFDFGFLCEMPDEESIAAMHAIVYSAGSVESVSIHTEMDMEKVAAAAAKATGAYTPPS